MEYLHPSTNQNVTYTTEQTVQEGESGGLLEQTRSDALVVTQNESKIFLQLFLLSFPVVCTPTFPWFAACLPAIPFRVETTPFNIVEIYDDG
jgi:hypothetical protein